MAREFLGNIKGPQGERGATGPKGADGKDADLSSSVIGTENLIDLTELINYDASGSQAVDLETGTILYNNTAYFIRNVKYLEAGTYHLRVDDYTEHSDYYAGRIRMNVRNSNTASDAFSGNVEKGQIYAFEVPVSAEYLLEFRVAGSSRKDGFIKKPMLVKGDGIANWQLSERDRNVYNNTKTQNLIELGETRTGNATGSVSVDYPKGRINFSNVSWTILSEEMSLENDIYYLRLPAFTSDRSGNKVSVTIRNNGSQLGDHIYVVGQNETVEIDLRDAGSTTLSINFMLANGQNLDGFIEKPLLTSDKVLGQWAPTEKEQREVPHFQEGDGDNSVEDAYFHGHFVSGTELASGGVTTYHTLPIRANTGSVGAGNLQFTADGTITLPKGTYIVNYQIDVDDHGNDSALILQTLIRGIYMHTTYLALEDKKSAMVTTIVKADEGDPLRIRVATGNSFTGTIGSGNYNRIHVQRISTVGATN